MLKFVGEVTCEEALKRDQYLFGLSVLYVDMY